MLSPSGEMLSCGYNYLEMRSCINHEDAVTEQDAQFVDIKRRKHALVSRIVYEDHTEGVCYEGA